MLLGALSMILFFVFVVAKACMLLSNITDFF